MTSVRAAHTRGLVFTAICHKSALPHFHGTIMPRNWQFAEKGVRIASVLKELDFYIVTSKNGVNDLLKSVLGIRIYSAQYHLFQTGIQFESE
jgi:hypothetical protein